MAQPDARIYRFGPYRLDASRGYLTRNNVPLPLGGRAIQLLMILVARHGELVTKEELTKSLWPSTIVEEGNLSTQIWTLRKALGDAERPHRWIGTVAGRGYRFAGELAPAPEQADPGDQGTSIAPIEVGPRGNLPRRLRRLVGRDDDIVRLTALVRAQALTTIAGPGGLGKTQLALSVGAELIGAFPDGVWFVPLERLSRSEEIVEAIAGFFGLTLTTGRSSIDILANYVARKASLLIFDNCEHLVEAVAATARTLLAAAPDLRILATSREPLRVADEHVHRPPTLSRPARGANVPLDAMARHSAIQLFAERAVATNEEFELTEANAPLVAEICDRLDGLPLAIELAVARLRIFALPDLAAALDDRFRVLSGGERAAPERHRTIEATIAWSFDLLGPEERRFFLALAVFGGDFSLAAASSVASKPEDATDAWELLARLDDKSLIVLSDERPGRFRLLESTRAFALARLEAAEARHCWERLTDFLIALFERAQADRNASGGEAWLARYGGELDNLRSALGWAFEPDGDTARGVTLISRSFEVWLDLSLYRERRRWLQLALAAADESTSPGTRARLLLADAPLMAAQKNLDPRIAQAIMLFRRTDDRLFLAMALRVAAFALARPSDVAAAEVHIAEAAELARPFGLTRTLLFILSTKATIAQYSGRMSAAKPLYAECAALSRRLQFDTTFVLALTNLAEIAFAEGHVAEAIARATEACDACRRTASLWTLADALQNLAAYRLVNGDLAEGRAAALEALELKSSLDPDLSLAYTLQHLALAAAREGDLARAARLAGHVERGLSEAGTVREPTESIAWAALLARLDAELSADEKAALMAEGAAWRAETAVATARGEWSDLRLA